jgi:hypothetical protein
MIKKVNPAATKNSEIFVRVPHESVHDDLWGRACLSPSIFLIAIIFTVKEIS